MKPIKYFLLSLSLLVLSSSITSISCADIMSADHDYQQGNHQLAYEQYEKLAQLGSNRARYNLAVMLSKGQGVKRDLIQAYAWAQLTDSQTELDIQTLKETLSNVLTAEQKPLAEAAARQLQSQLGDEPILARWAPIRVTDQDRESTHDDPSFNLTILQRTPPRYPKKEYLYGTQGWVRVGFDVYPDGSVRNPYVIESVPENAFDEVTLEAITQFRFRLEFTDGTQPHPVHATQMIQYRLPSGKSDESLAQMYQQRLEQLKKMADQGHPTAQYYYALAASSRSMIKDHVDLSAESVNDWLLKAAQNGNLDAQYQLGYHIFYGKGCQADKQRGVNWLTLAAEGGHAKAARQAYNLLTRHDLHNESDQPVTYWLLKAAESGDVEAKLSYAEYLAHSPQLSTEEVSLIDQFLDEYKAERDQSVQYHQVLAQYHSLTGNEKKAAKAQKKAEKLARKLGWDLSL
jgi:TonB family protein